MGRIAAEAAGRAPDQHDVTLLHGRAVVADQLTVGGGVDQAGGGGLLPGQVFGLGHQLIRLHQGQFGQAAEVRLEAPDSLLRIHHGVVVALRVLELDRQAVRDDPVADLPLGHAGADLEHDAGKVGSHDVIRQIVLLGQLGGLAVAACRKENVETGSKIEVQTVL